MPLSFFSRYHNSLLLLIFFIITAAILSSGYFYKQGKITEYELTYYSNIADTLTNELVTLIDEQQKATLPTALSLAQSETLAKQLTSDNYRAETLYDFSMRLRQETDFKNVWIQLIDNQGISRSRSWVKKHGDNLANIREDVRSMLNRPEVKSTISVGRFDMTFKAMVPIFSEDATFLGFIEVITHFNSIANKIKAKGFEPVILVNERFRAHITNPFTKTFIGGHYVANKSVDLSLLNYIHFKGTKFFISTHNNYVIDHERQNIVVNYTLFDTEHKPMANFLMFKPLDELDRSPISNITSTINLYMLLTIIVSGFVLFQLSNQSELAKKVQQQHIRIIVIFAMIYLLVGSIYYMLLAWNFEQKNQRFIKSYTTNVTRDYVIIHDKFNAIAQTIFETVVNRPDVMAIMAQAAHATEQQRNELRKALYDKLIKEYEYFKGLDLRQFHFHLPNNESFLRFHRPEKYGDNLTNIRHTIAWVNANHRPINGFEEGRIFNGFRHVFPLQKTDAKGDREHIGSVEISFSAYAFAREFSETHNTKSSFLIKMDVVENKVFDSEKGNYIISPLPGYLYDTTIKKQLEHGFIHADLSLFDEQQMAEIVNGVEKGHTFSIEERNGHALFTIVPLKNPITKKSVGMLIIQADDSSIAQYQGQFIILLLSGMIFFLLLLLFVYRELKSKLLYQQQLKKTQQILDAQRAIVIITDGVDIVDCNRMFLEFLGYESLEGFKKSYNCICEKFIENDRFFHLGKVPDGENWIHIIEQLPQKEHIVSIMSTRNEAHVFTVSINHYESNYIISFSDISDTIYEQFTLEKRATEDKLTGAFNRDYFDHNIGRLMQEALDNQLQLGVIIFDIDHFKHINDTYGHEYGDKVLRELVRLIKSSTRLEDTLIRWGGEEFLLLVKTNSLDHVTKIAENIRKEIELLALEKVGQITCSFGVTLHPDHEFIETAIRRADKALYEAKAAGRNRVVSL